MCDEINRYEEPADIDRGQDTWDVKGNNIDKRYRNQETREYVTEGHTTNRWSFIAKIFRGGWKKK